MRSWWCWSALVASGLAFSSAAAQESPSPPALKVLLATTDPERGQHFRAFFARHEIACTVAKYEEVSSALLDEHDMLMADTPEGSFREVSSAIRRVSRLTLPRTEKPIFAIAQLGYLILRPYGIAIGRVKT